MTKYLKEGGGYSFDFSKSYIGGQPEVISYPDSHTNQTGAGGGYNYIVNPFTNRKVSIFGKRGKEIIKHYLKNLK